MKITAVSEENKLHLKLSGNIDTDSIKELEKELKNLFPFKEKEVLMDLSRVSYLNSSGIRALLNFSEQISRNKKSLVIHSVPDKIMDVLRIASVDEALTITKEKK